jgi:predicted nucleic acid-binding protein
LSIDLRSGLRRRKPERRLVQFKARQLSELVAADAVAATGRPSFVPDTNVYILEAAGRLVPAAQALVARGLMFHCSVCLGELATGVANADPTGATWPALRDHYSELFNVLPRTRILTPEEDVWIDASIIAGTLARTQGFQRHQRKECLNDALIYLTAAKAGLPVLTQNREQFDLIQQLAPEGQFIHF